MARRRSRSTLAIRKVVVRVWAGFGGAGSEVLLATSGVLWSAAYGGFALAYGPMLLGWPAQWRGRPLPA